MVLGRLPYRAAFIANSLSFRRIERIAIASAIADSKPHNRTDRRLCQHASNTRIEQTADRHLAPAGLPTAQVRRA